MQELVPSRLRHVLVNSPVAHIGVVAGGDPYVTPISYVWMDDLLWFRTTAGERLKALATHPRVSCEISSFDVATGDWESVIVTGDARVVDDPDQEAEMMRAVREKYRRITRSALELPPDVLPREGYVVAVHPVEVSGRASNPGMVRPDLPGRL